jgi:hypothetical protein
VSKRNILFGVDDVYRGSRRISGVAVYEAVLDDTRRAIIREARAAGMATEVRLAEKVTQDLAEDMRIVHDIESIVVARYPRLHPRSSIIRLSTPPSTGAFEWLYARLHPRLRFRCGLAAKTLVEGGTDLRRLGNNIAGVIRECITTVFPDVVAAVGRVTSDVRRRTFGSKVFSRIDSAVLGDIRLPTREREGERLIKLGSDRLVGVGRVEPTVVPAIWEHAKVDEFVRVAGILEARHVVEVKGASNAKGGVAQMRALAARGEQGYVIIGGQLWLLVYEPAKVEHLIVAPPGGTLAAAIKGAAEMTDAGTNTKVLTYAKELDDSIKAMGDRWLEAARIVLAQGR